MRRTLIIIAAAILLTGCAAEPRHDVVPATASVYTAPAEAATVLKATKDFCLRIDDPVTDMNGIRVTGTFENRTDEVLELDLQYMMVNGWEIRHREIFKAEPGERIAFTRNIPAKKLAQCGLSDPSLIMKEVMSVNVTTQSERRILLMDSFCILKTEVIDE